MTFIQKASRAAEILAILGLGLTLAACENSTAKKRTPAPPPVASAPSLSLARLPVPPSSPLQSQLAPAPYDAVQQIIEDTESSYRQGEEDYRQGHLDRARRSFDQAVDTMLRSPLPVQSEERLEKEFESLIDRIHEYETAALKEGDAFTTKKYQPAASDETLAVETFPSRVD